MTIEESWELYQSMYELAAGVAEKSPRLEELRWQEKLAIRQRIVRILAEVDRIKRESRAADDPDGPHDLAQS